MKRKLILTGLFLAPFFLPIAFAQENQNDTELVKRQTTAEKRVARAAAKASEKYTGDSVVTFQEVLKNPDDVQLNLKYAKKQIAENELLGASGTLERILLVNPDLYEVRLLYAVVLYRLDNWTEAQRELDKLENAPLPDNLRAEWKAYRSQLKLRQRRTRFALRESAGLQIDSNRNAAPSSKQILFSDTTLDNTVDNRRKRDNSFINVATLEATHDLGLQAGHQLIASFTHYLQTQAALPSLDLGSFQYEFGTALKNKHVNFTPTYTGSHVFLSDENYLRTQGGNFVFDRAFKKWDLALAYKIENQQYLAIKENTSAPDRSGVENTINFGAGYTITSSMKVGANTGYTYKNAQADFEGYQRFIMRIYHVWLLGQGQFLINGIDNYYDRYDEPDTSVASRYRHDKTLRYRVTYGAPLGFFIRWRRLPEQVRDVTFSISYEYFRELSNITNYSYTNNSYQMLWTKKIEF